jgi:quercetin dioxygenase-like cupin family protein
MQEVQIMEKGKKQTEGNLLTAQVSELAALITYQEGSVVSRTLIDKDAGTVTVFAFAEGQGLSEHTAPFDALVLVYEGQADITIAGKPLHLKEGEMTLMPANKPHALKAVTRFKMLLVMVKG